MTSPLKRFNINITHKNINRKRGTFILNCKKIWRKRLRRWSGQRNKSRKDIEKESRKDRGGRRKKRCWIRRSLLLIMKFGNGIQLFFPKRILIQQRIVLSKFTYQKYIDLFIMIFELHSCIIYFIPWNIIKIIRFILRSNAPFQKCHLSLI